MHCILHIAQETIRALLSSKRFQHMLKKGRPGIINLHVERFVDQAWRCTAHVARPISRASVCGKAFGAYVMVEKGDAQLLENSFDTNTGPSKSNAFCATVNWAKTDSAF